VWPGGPGLPRGPAPPDSPGGPLSPGDPTAPGEPRCPVNPVGPVAPVAPVAPDGPGGPETFKQRHTLLHLIRYLELYSGLDLGLAHILGLACTQNYILHFCYTRRMAIANGTCVSLCTFWPPWVRPWDNRGKCYMDGNMIQTHRSIYPSIFYLLRPIARYCSEIATFSYPLHLIPPSVLFPLEFRGKVLS